LRELPHDEALSWEKQTASPYSPGAIADGEQLCRYWINPVHYDEGTGKLKATAFEDAAHIGLSINRLPYTTLDQIRAIASDRVDQENHRRAGGPQRRLVGYSLFHASLPRSVQTNDGQRAFAVYDTANASDPSHGDVCQLVSNAQGARSARSQMRAAVVDDVQYFE
jgi:hypothetical protein